MRSPSLAAVAALLLGACAPDTTNPNDGILRPGLYELARIGSAPVPVTLTLPTPDEVNERNIYHGDSVRVEPDSTFTLYLSITPEDPAGAPYQEAIPGWIELVPGDPFTLRSEDARFDDDFMGLGQFTAGGMVWNVYRLGGAVSESGPITLGFDRLEED
jgi:hypothetical protein